MAYYLSITIRQRPASCRELPLIVYKRLFYKISKEGRRSK